MAAPASWRSEEHLRQSLQTGVQVTPVPFSGAGPKAEGLGSVVPRQVLPPSGVTQSERPPALWMLLQLAGPSPTPTRGRLRASRSTLPSSVSLAAGGRMVLVGPSVWGGVREYVV